jgi:uncharacterized protein YggE
MSTQTRLLTACGVLVAITSASLTAVALTLLRPAAPTTPPPQVYALAASTTGNTITVVGIGSAYGAPNQVDLGLGVSATRPNVRDAVTAASGDLTHLLNALHSQGVQDKDIQTTSIWVAQQTNCCPQNVVGYNASSQLSITVHSIGGATPLIEAAVEAVGNDLQINGPTLSVADTSAMLKSARANAMNNANSKAQDWARLSGHHVGGLVGVSEIVSTPNGFACDQCGGKGGAGGGFQILGGSTSVTVTVAVTYELTT